MVGVSLRKQRIEFGLSQSKLSDITGIKQARLSAFELQKQELTDKEIDIIRESLNLLDNNKIKALKKKRYREHIKDGLTISSRPRRGYAKTLRNEEYLNLLDELGNKFNSEGGDNLKAMSFFAGCGGLCYGVKAAGFNIVATNELQEAY
ncbi:hypothetical protein BMR08_16970, partial [Methylococcaceae bacterium CS2]